MGGPPGYGPPPGAPPGGPGGYGPPPGGYGPPPGGYGPPGGFGPPGGMMQGGPKVNPLAIVSLICGILSMPSCFCCFASPLALAAVITGVIGLQQIRGNPQAWTGAGMAIAGIVCGGIGVSLHALAWFTPWDEAIRLRSGF
jgi:hypothetical protein